MYRVAVWDDDYMDLEELGTLAETILREMGVKHSVDRFLSGKDLLSAMETGTPYHLLLLDIICDGPQGMELAAWLRGQKMESSIIFVSNSKNYILEGYDVHAVSYLLKPPDQNKLADAIGYALRHGPHPTQTISIKINGEWVGVRQPSVVYLESALHNVLIHLTDGSQLKCRGKIDDLSTRFFDVPFAKCHKSYRVNLAYVRRVQREWLELEGGLRLPISRSMADKFIEEFLSYKTNGLR